MSGGGWRRALIDAHPTWHRSYDEDGDPYISMHTDEQAVDIILGVLHERPDLLVSLLRASEHAVELSPRRVYIGSACDEFKAQMRADQGWHGFLVKSPPSGEPVCPGCGDLLGSGDHTLLACDPLDTGEPGSAAE